MTPSSSWREWWGGVGTGARATFQGRPREAGQLPAQPSLTLAGLGQWMLQSEVSFLAPPSLPNSPVTAGTVGRGSPAQARRGRDNSQFQGGTWARHPWLTTPGNAVGMLLCKFTRSVLKFPCYSHEETEAQRRERTSPQQTNSRHRVGAKSVGHKAHKASPLQAPNTHQRLQLFQ